MTPELLETPSPSATLPSVSASEIKKQGWRSVIATVRRQGHLRITNHNTSEAVILSPEEYDRLAAAAEYCRARLDSRFDELRHRFDARLKSLKAPDAGNRLRHALRTPITPDDNVIAGDSH